MEIKINTVYHGDCRDLMKAMIEQGIVADWCIADPPYGIGEDGAKNETRSSHNIAPTKFTHKDWDKERITKDYFDLMRTCSKNQIIFGGNYYSDFLPSPFGNNFAVWDKRSGNKNRNDFSDCEVAWCSTGGGRMFRFVWDGMVQGDMKNKEKRIHPTQKPVALITMLLNYYTKEDDLIIDPFMGSFSTAIACHKNNRRFIGAEKDDEYFENGSKRLSEVQSQMSIFDLQSKRRTSHEQMLLFPC